MNVLDLFSGIGGFSLGLERAGMRTVAFCEIEPYCRAVLKKHWPGVPCIDDVRTDEFPEADVISAGFPCQDISFAGNGAGLAGERSGLYREVIRAIRLVRPDFAVLENVAALLSRGLDTVLGDLAEVGYDAEWHCIPASAVGAPHRRDRIWIIADAGDEQHEGGRAPFSGAIAEGLYQANEAGQLRHIQSEERAASSSETMANAECVRQPRPGQPFDAIVSAAHGEGQTGNAFDGGVGNQWAVEPDVGRVANGVPSRVDRLRCLGNSAPMSGRRLLRTPAAYLRKWEKATI